MTTETESSPWVRPEAKPWSKTVQDLVPRRNEIPKEFKSSSNKYTALVETWFFDGLDAARIKERPGINREAAITHLARVMNSREIEHLHKTASAAYLLSQWFEIV